MGPEMTHTQPDDVKLHLHFPMTEYGCEVQAINRAYRDQMMVGQYFAGYTDHRSPLIFSSVLTPGQDTQPPFFDSFRTEKGPKGAGLQFTIGGKTYTLFDRYAYESKIEDLNKRPAYSFDAGKESVFDLETDAYGAMTIEEKDATYYSGVDFSRLIHKGETLFEMEAMDQLQLDFEDPLKRTTSWSNWDNRIQKG